MHDMKTIDYLQITLMLPLHQSVLSAMMSLLDEIHPTFFFLISVQNVASEKMRIRER
jgi:hypothetical protein